MAELSKRELLAGAAAAAAARSSNSWPRTVAPADRRLLLDYAHANPAKLLRPPPGVLRFPSIAPSLPRSQYATDLWD